MASSGSFNTTNYDGRYLTFAWTIASQLSVVGPDSAVGLAAGPDFVFGPAAGPGLVCSGFDSADFRSVVASFYLVPKPDCIWFPNR